MATLNRVPPAASRALTLAELEAEGLTVVEWTDPPDADYADHAHTGREVRVVLEGSMRMTAGGRAYELGRGDRIDLEPGEMHAMRVGENGVRYLAGTERS